MKNFFTLLIILFIFSNAFSSNIWYKVRINLEGKDLSVLAKTGIDLNSGMFRKNAYFETDLSDIELKKVADAGFKYKILIEDVSSYYANRAANDHYKIDRGKEKDEEWPMPENWELGSMGGFYTLDEIMSELDDMHTLYPDLISERAAISDINLTHEGRKQFWVKISDNPDADENEPEILFTGLHHAREPMSYQQMIWFMWYLLENYDSNPEIKLLVDNTEMYFIPVVNPDGFEYNRQTNPNGGGMWRKNRRNNGNGYYGVDPNRNYGYMWGIDNDGSSPDPSSETYRGPSAFSEPIIANIRDFCNNHEFKLALNYHSYSNLLLYSWGYTPDLPPDYDLFDLYAQMMTKENNYTIGPANTTIYGVNGDSNDWMYGEQDTKDKILAYTPEIGGYSDGFWPSTSRIVPLCREQMWQNMTAVKLVGKYAVAKDLSPAILSEDYGYLKFDITRLGLADCDTFKVSVEPLDPSAFEAGEPVVFSNMDLMETKTDSISYHILLNPDVVQTVKYLLKVDNGMFETVDTITKYYGVEMTIFEDDGNTMNNWTTDEWGVTTEAFHSPSGSITDSPGQDYDNYSNTYVTLDTTISLTGSPIAFLSFWAKWSIEQGWDYAQVMIKTDNTQWTPLASSYTVTGNENQDEGEPVYDGTQNNWVYEEIPLVDYVGEEIQVKFRLVSDGYTTDDGFYFDDFKISVISSVTDIDNKFDNYIFVSNPYPNPADETVSFSYYLPQNTNGTCRLISVTGNVLYEKNIVGGNNVLNINVSQFKPGIYFLKVDNENKQVVKKVIIK